MRALKAFMNLTTTLGFVTNLFGGNEVVEEAQQTNSLKGIEQNTKNQTVDDQTDYNQTSYDQKDILNEPDAKNEMSIQEQTNQNYQTDILNELDAKDQRGDSQISPVSKSDSFKPKDNNLETNNILEDMIATTESVAKKVFGDIQSDSDDPADIAAYNSCLLNQYEEELEKTETTDSTRTEDCAYSYCASDVLRIDSVENSGIKFTVKSISKLADMAKQIKTVNRRVLETIKRNIEELEKRFSNCPGTSYVCASFGTTTMLIKQKEENGHKYYIFTNLFVQGGKDNEKYEKQGKPINLCTIIHRGELNLFEVEKAKISKDKENKENDIKN